ncbi:biotin-dependent carboxyltransferase family protein [Bacillus pinisoli]|uniref:5-oxoprolinase subunit C family protein n=1 Tax=Bacillus pinisoli TaxID=2901866 RepID=UPI001FF44DE5|nr:biotin-dependent carboxyltransferase family protein [Bacillus pinisoli]
MSKALFQVNNKGLATSFQDTGRYGYQRFGVVASGAMDMEAMTWANQLVGNPASWACMEICLVGPSLTFLADVTFSICGANLSPSLNDQPIQGWRTYKATTGDKLTFGKQVNGNYAYLAVSGGYESESVMGSQSTYSKAGLGTDIISGDTIYGNPKQLPMNRGLTTELVPFYHEQIHVRYIPGPHLDNIHEDSLKGFENQVFTFWKGDRMGYRLKGVTPIQTKDDATLSSNPIPLGGIQIPPDGHPIVLLADRQTTGGYPRIGTVISTDLSKLVQLPMRKGSVQFKSITIEEAQELYMARYKQHKIYSYI